MRSKLSTPIYAVAFDASRIRRQTEEDSMERIKKAEFFIRGFMLLGELLGALMLAAVFGFLDNF